MSPIGKRTRVQKRRLHYIAIRWSTALACQARRLEAVDAVSFACAAFPVRLGRRITQYFTLHCIVSGLRDE